MSNNNLHALNIKFELFKNDGDWVAARDIAEKMILLEPTNTISNHAIGLSIAKMGNLAAAESYLRFAAINEWNNTEFIHNYARCLDLQHKEEASTYFARAANVEIEKESFSKLSATIFNNYGYIHAKKENYFDAVTYFKKAVEIEPEDLAFKKNLAACCYNIGISHFLAKFYSLAQVWFSQACNLEPENVDFLQNLGGAYKESGDYRGALGCIRKVVELSPSNVESIADLVNILFLSSEYAEAIEVCEKNLCFFDKSAKLSSLYAKGLVALKQHEKAEKVLYEAINRSPSEATYYSELADIANKQGNIHKAISLFTKAFELDPSSSSIAANLGYSYFQVGQYYKAEKNIKLAISLNGENDLAHFYLGICLRKMECPADAGVHLLKALELNTFNSQYSAMYGQYLMSTEEDDNNKNVNSIIEYFNDCNIMIYFDAIKLKGGSIATNNHDNRFYKLTYINEVNRECFEEAFLHIKRAIWADTSSPEYHLLLVENLRGLSFEENIWGPHRDIAFFLQGYRSFRSTETNFFTFNMPLPCSMNLVSFSNKEKQHLAKAVFFTLCASTYQNNIFYLTEAISHSNNVPISLKNADEDTYPILHLLGCLSAIEYVTFKGSPSILKNAKWNGKRHWLAEKDNAEIVYKKLINHYVENTEDTSPLDNAVDLFQKTVDFATTQDDPNLALYIADLCQAMFIRLRYKKDLQGIEKVFNLCDQVIQLGYEKSLGDAFEQACKTASELFETSSFLDEEETDKLIMFLIRLIKFGNELKKSFCDWGVKPVDAYLKTDSLASKLVFLNCRKNKQISFLERILVNEKSIEAIEGELFQQLGMELSLNIADIEALKRYSSEGRELATKYCNSLFEWQKLFEERLEPKSKQDTPLKIRTARQEVFKIAQKINSDQSLPITFLTDLNAQNIKSVARKTESLVYITYTPLGGNALIVLPKEDEGDNDIIPLSLPKLTVEVVESITAIYFESYNEYIRKYNAKWLNSRHTKEDEKVVFQSFSNLLTVIDQMLNDLWTIGLGLIHKTLQKLKIKKIIFIPSGKLSLIPLHASYKENFSAKLLKNSLSYFGKQNKIFWGRSYFLDNIVVSYAPAARFLYLNQSRLSKRSKPITELQCWYSPYNNEGHNLFEKESKAILESAPIINFTRRPLLNRPNEILSSMSKAFFFQFSGHGSTGSVNFLSESGLKIGENEDDILPIIQILKNRFENLHIAFLSSCEGGLRDTYIPNEGACISTALLYSGASGCASPFHIVSTEATAQIVPEFWKYVAKNAPSDFYDGAKYLWEVQLRVRKGKLKIKFENRDGLYASQNVKHPFYWAGFYWNGL